MRFHQKLIGGSFLIITTLLIGVGYLTWQTTKDLQKTSNSIMKENVTSLKAAEELEIALLSQKGLVSNYFLDKNQEWLSVLEQKRKDFDFWFDRAQEAALTPEEKIILGDIQELYKKYDSERHKVIALFEAGDVDLAKQVLFEDVKKRVDQLYFRCEDLILVNERLMARAESFSRQHTRRMGTVIWVMLISVLILGGLLGHSFSLRISAELVRSEKLASLGRLSATIAHEIRNPLTSVKMRIYSLKKETAGKKGAAEDLLTIENEIARLERIVQSFLDFSKLPDPNTKSCGLNDILDGIIELVSPKALSQGIVVSKKYQEDLPSLEADPDQLKQAFLNLALNAIEAMPTGGKLSIASFRDSKNSQGNSLLGVTMTDTGIGIEPKAKEKLFEPFFTTKQTGTGLGLYITRKIIESHKGEILLQNQGRSGVEVLVRIPSV
jgi:signal transduction histidine kinase